MKYFTKEELEDITKELIETPTRETLKKLAEKYNGNPEVGTPLEMITSVANEKKLVVEPIAPTVVEQNPVISPMPTVVEESQLVSPISNYSVSNMEIPKTENIINNNFSVTDTPTFELPKLETPIFNNQNNQPVNFSGNLWEIHKPEVSNLMETTDNFSANPNMVSTSDVPVTSVPFFGPSIETVNNPIPVNSRPIQGPTMFGQFEQNYM